MAGVAAGNAGTLSIQLVAEIARLQADLDKAKKLVNAASSDIAKSAKHANDNLAGMASGIGKAGNQSKLASHHVQNLAFQFQDIAVGLYSGQKPLTVFMQQGSQIAGVMAQAGIGVGGLVSNVAGMVTGFIAANPLLVAAAAAAGVLAAGIGLMTDEINKNSDVHVTWMDTLLGIYDAIKAAISEKVTAAFQAMGLDIGEVWETVKSFTKSAINIVIGMVTMVPRAIAATYEKIPAAFGDAFYSAANLAVAALNWLIGKTAAGVNGLVDTFNAVFGTDIKRVALGGIDALSNPYQGAMANLGKAGAKAFTGTFTTDYLGDAAAAVSPFAQARARQRIEEDAEKAGKAAGKKAGRAAGKAMADEMVMSFAEAFKDFQIDPAILKVWNDTAAIQERIEALRREAKAVELVGWERERLLLILDKTADIQKVKADLDAAEQAGNAELVRTLQAKIAAMQEELRLKILNGNATEAATKKQNDFNDSLWETIDLLQQIGGLGGVLGKLLGFLTGDFDSINGPLGVLLRTSVTGKDGEIRKLGDVLKEAIGDQSGILAKAIEGMGVGLMASTAILGKQGTIGQLGSAIGGAIGGKVGEKFLTNGLEKVFKGLGDFAGPLGSILGGLAGSLIGKLFGSTKRGSAVISGGDISGFYGNSGKMKDQAGQIAGGLLDTLQQIANQFGATLDEQAMGKISIGVRDGKYAVDTLGRGYTKSSIAGVKSFGTDAEAAVEYALKLMLDRGAIKMREGSMKIIKEATDLQEGLTRALQFEEIMNELEGGGSQLVAQVRAIRNQFQQYISVMKQAGASVQDLTRVQEMQVQRINALIAQAGDSYRSTFYTDAQNVAFAQQTIKSVLDPLGKGWIDTVAEYMAEVEAAQAAVNGATDETRDAALAYLETLYSLSDEFGALKAAAEAAAAAAAAAKAQKEADAAAAAAERERKKQDKERAIEAAQDVLRQAFDRQAGELQQTIDKFAALGDSLRDFRDSLTDTVSSTANAARLLAKFKELGRAASLGDAEAMGGLAGAGKDYLAAAKSQAASFEEYQRAVALVRRVTEGAIGAADAGKTVAQQQLDQLKSQVGQLIDLNAGVVSVEKAIQELLKLTGGGTANPQPSTPPPSGNPGQTRNTSEIIADALARAEQRRLQNRADAEERKKEREEKRLAKVEERLAEQQPVLERMARATERTNKFWDILTKGGQSIPTEPVA